MEYLEPKQKTGLIVVLTGNGKVKTRTLSSLKFRQLLPISIR